MGDDDLGLGSWLQCCFWYIQARLLKRVDLGTSQIPSPVSLMYHALLFHWLVDELSLKRILGVLFQSWGAAL